MDAYDRECEILYQQLNDGELSQKEFNEAMRDLNAGLREQAEEAARNAYDDFMRRY